MTAVGALVLAVVTLTSVFAWVVSGRPGISRLGRALLFVAEIVGATVLFFAANVVIGVTLVLAARALSPFHTTLYDVSDLALLIVSALQAIAFEACRRLRGEERRSKR